MTTVQLSDELVRHLQTITGQEGADAAMRKVLEDYIHQRQLRVLKFAGQFDADLTYNYKEQRRMDERKN